MQNLSCKYHKILISKPQETLEFKMNKQKEKFRFDTPLLLEDSWLMGVTNLQVYNTVYNITPKNKKLKRSIY